MVKAQSVPARVSEASRFASSELPYSVRRSPFTVRRSPFGVRRLAFAVHRSPSPFAVRRSPFTVHRSPFAVWRLAFTVWRSPFGVAVRRAQGAVRTSVTLLAQDISNTYGTRARGTPSPAASVCLGSKRQSETLRLVRLKVRTNSGVEVPIGQSTGCP